jgi:hypothetical protein
MTTNIVDNRTLGLKIGYAATDWRHPMDYDTYEQEMADWHVSVIIRDLEPIGAVYRKDGETHVSILPHWRQRWLTRGLLKKLLTDTRSTRVDDGNDFMYGVLERLGFRRQPDGMLTREI